MRPQYCSKPASLPGVGVLNLHHFPQTVHLTLTSSKQTALPPASEKLDVGARETLSNAVLLCFQTHSSPPIARGSGAPALSTASPPELPPPATSTIYFSSTSFPQSIKMFKYFLPLKGVLLSLSPILVSIPASSKRHYTISVFSNHEKASLPASK